MYFVNHCIPNNILYILTLYCNMIWGKSTLRREKHIGFDNEQTILKIQTLWRVEQKIWLQLLTYEAIATYNFIQKIWPQLFLWSDYCINIFSNITFIEFNIYSLVIGLSLKISALVSWKNLFKKQNTNYFNKNYYDYLAQNKTRRNPVSNGLQ